MAHRCHARLQVHRPCAWHDSQRCVGMTASAERGTETFLLTPEYLRSAEQVMFHTLCQGSSDDNCKEGVQGASC